MFEICQLMQESQKYALRTSNVTYLDRFLLIWVGHFAFKGKVEESVKNAPRIKETFDIM